MGSSTDEASISGEAPSKSWCEPLQRSDPTPRFITNRCRPGRLRKASILKDPYSADIARTKKKSWAGIRNGLRQQARKEKKELKAVEKDIASLVTAMVHDMSRLQDQLLEGSEQPAVDVLARKLESLLEAMHDEVMPMIEELRNRAGAQESFAKAY